jgi:hypothetical protein
VLAFVMKINHQNGMFSKSGRIASAKTFEEPFQQPYGLAKLVKDSYGPRDESLLLSTSLDTSSPGRNLVIGRHFICKRRGAARHYRTPRQARLLANQGQFLFRGFLRSCGVRQVPPHNRGEAGQRADGAYASAR